MKCEKTNCCNTKISQIAKINANTYKSTDAWTFINYLDTGNITENKIDCIQYLDCENDKIPSRAKRKVKNNSIIYSTVRPNQKHYGILKKEINNLLVSTGFSVIDVDENYASVDYVYYWLTQESITNSLHAIAEQSVSTYPSIKPEDIGNLEIDLPELTTQKKIAKVLSAIDDKIELNNEINQNLQEQAQAIFKSWFIDFEPFGGTMPNDWRISTLGEIANITMGQSPNGESYNEQCKGILFFQGRTEFEFRFPNHKTYTTEPKRTAEVGDILMSVRAPVGDINIADCKCCIGRGLCSIRSKNNQQSYTFYLLHSLRNKLDTFNGEGTVFGSISKNDLQNIAIINPTDTYVIKFENIVSKLDERIKNNCIEIQKLIQLRDTLLPKLMNGEIDVDKVKI